MEPQVQAVPFQMTLLQEEMPPVILSGLIAEQPKLKMQHLTTILQKIPVGPFIMLEQ